MAKILTTAIVADIRNKLNGSVFSKNRYGSYVRTKVTPVNPQTTAQQAARNNLSSNSQAWRGLTEDQRKGWIASAINFPFTDIYGSSRTLSGNALYNKLNNNLINTGNATIADAPSPVAIPAILSLSVSSAGAGATTVQFPLSPIPADFALQIFACTNIGPGKEFVKNLFRFIETVAAAGTSPVTVTSAIDTKFGAPVTGNKIFVRVFLVSTITGQAGIPLQAQALIS